MNVRKRDYKALVPSAPLHLVNASGYLQRQIRAMHDWIRKGNEHKAAIAAREAFHAAGILLRAIETSGAPRYWERR
jgi:hypothetical protein